MAKNRDFRLYDRQMMAHVRVTTGPKHSVSMYDSYVCKYDDPPEYNVHLDNRRDFYALAHECLHLANRILEDRGIAKDEELVAYVQNYWLRRIWRKIG